MMQRRTRSVGETIHAAFPITLKPLVTSLAAYPEAPTDTCKCLFLLFHRHHKTHPFIHGTGLQPSHRQGPPCQSVDLLPMSPVYSVTHVAGLDPGGTLPFTGRVAGGSRAGPTSPLY